MKKIAITTTSFGKYGQDVLVPIKECGYEIVFNSYGRKLEKNEILDLCKDSVGIIAGTEKMTGDILNNLKELKVISRCGVGTDNIDLAAAQNLGIKVYNTPDAPTEAVAELTLGLILNVLRDIGQMDKDIRKGNWNKTMGNLLYQKKVGILGYGRIGKKVADLLAAFDCEIAFNDLNIKTSSPKIKNMNKEELLKWADILTLHVSGSKQLIGGAEMDMMKKNAILINVSRGGVVDEQCLYEHLKNKKLKAAAMDVFAEEPYQGPLIGLNNVTLTPHIGSYAVESRIEMEKQAVNNLLEGMGVKQ